MNKPLALIIDRVPSGSEAVVANHHVRIDRAFILVLLQVLHGLVNHGYHLGGLLLSILESCKGWQAPSLTGIFHFGRIGAMMIIKRGADVLGIANICFLLISSLIDDDAVFRPNRTGEGRRPPLSQTSSIIVQFFGTFCQEGG